ncbi:MAG: glutathione S-transferase family protein [Rhodospirillaceae bacterium]|jgi:glutathione S-transferase|nr:glutathione S-transferase family protein [Rhodospirillaceae bacterium]MBT5243878.1 glutathione S-transferase family protein [Rhodospirillaceae bacterium]MBT5562927.1 glutathione S-transferase family protein [Rhodospirillaceae bacterium]MBT6241326.1 glutathione S-transferase family protein [Rhodospirillaceae bacterium]MBT7137668.1 glutathione S-transferase family protein [Rhodospirillaceae bacterium]
MSAYTLYIGNKNYSSWSLRPWLAMKVAGIPFEEKLILLFDDDWKANIAKVSPSARVPVLVDGGQTIWETMAILEYLAERHPDKGLWPEGREARAMARSVSNEMHAGFTALRGNMPMNIRKSHPGKGMGEGVAEDIARVSEIWNDCRKRFGADGPFLFGKFCNADAMFAPVVSRLTTFAVELDAVSAAYRDAVQALPEMIEWSDAGRAEPWTVSEDEID